MVGTTPGVPYLPVQRILGPRCCLHLVLDPKSPSGKMGPWSSVTGAGVSEGSRTVGCECASHPATIAKDRITHGSPHCISAVPYTLPGFITQLAASLFSQRHLLN